MADASTPPVPDPTVLTTEALARAIAAERDYVDGQLDVLQERLRGIDTATKLLNETVNRVPTDVTKEVTHLRELMEGQFESVALQFKERDTRSERESKDNQIRVAAAFAASKEASSEQNKSNTTAITKSEGAMTESITKLAELFRTEIKALKDNLDELKSRVNGAESLRQGGVESRTEGRAAISSTTAIIGAVVAVIVVAIALYTGRAKTPTVVTPTPPTVTVTTPTP
jgi:predicted nuclease with TOPRIM domain